MKICKCGNEYKQYTSMQTCCIECLAEKVAKNRVRADKSALQTKKRELIKAKEAIKPLKHWEEKAQAVFNRFIRARDGNICISCGTQNPNIQYAAGHYRTRKAANQLRYNEDNVHTQCNKRCNSALAGNIPAYRPALIAKIGQDRHDALINNHETKRWTKEACQGIELFYKNRLKDMKECD